MDHSNYHHLISKLDSFIRKYYKSQLIRGAIYTVSLVLAFYLLAITLEYFGQFGSGVRTALFYLFVLGAAGVMTKFIAIPLFKLNRIGKLISYDQAATIIGKHFTDVEDKLLNTLQLKAEAETNSSLLLDASINQRASELRPVPFTAAVDLKENRKYMKYVVPPVLALCIILFAAPSILTDGTDRLINHGEYFESQAPFQFTILNNDLSVVEQEDYELQVELVGKEDIPNNLYIEIGNTSFKLNKESTVNFSYLFKNVQEEITFQLRGDDHYSQEYTLSTLPNPIILNFDLQLHYPSYTGQSDEIVKNNGNLMVPEGTQIKWLFNTQNTETLSVLFADTTFNLEPGVPNTFTLNKQLVRSERYSVVTSNSLVQSSDSIEYRINVVPDQYPQIMVDEQVDTMSIQRKYFSGNIEDDYGFSRLTFNYKFLESNDTLGMTDMDMHTIEIPINNTASVDQFMYFWDMTGLNIQRGDRIQYYFEIWDNDGVNGSKSTRSSVMMFNAPTLEEISEQTDQQNQEIKEDIEDAMEEAQDLRNDWEKTLEEMYQKTDMNWQDQQKIEDLLNRQKELENQIEEMQQQMEENTSEQNEFMELDPELKEKQEQLQELFDEMMTDELKELMEEIQKMMEEMNKDGLQEKMEEMDKSNKDMEKELDRMLELFKQMEMDMKLEQTMEKLEELAEDQQELAEMTEDKELSNEELSEMQEELNERFDDIQEDMDELQEMNDQLENPREMDEMDEMEQGIEQSMQESQEQLDNNKNNKSSEQMEESSDQMEEMADAMQSMMNMMTMEQQQEDMDALRQLLENLITLSFDQEAIMEQLKNTSTTDPLYVDLGKQQRDLQRDAQKIEDSLFALSKRIPQLESVVNREISSINENMSNTVEYMSERQTGNATSQQQYAMTSINNLALLLDEALQQMQQQMSMQMPGMGMCENPGGNSPKPSSGLPSIQQMQESLEQQLQQLKEQMEKGSKPGPGEEGELPFQLDGGQGQGLSEQLSKAAATQAEIREQLQKLADEWNNDGSGFGNQLKEIVQQMEEIERDIINGNITEETFIRQKDIMTRLLESEKAEREREFKEERQSNEAQDELFSNPDAYFEYNLRKQKEIELLKTVPPSLKPYYKNKVNEYFNTFEE